MIKFTESDFSEVYKESEHFREENTMNYFTIVLSLIRHNHNVSYNFDKIFKINNYIIDKNNHSPTLAKYQFDYFEGDTLEHFMSTSIESSIKSLQEERPEGRTLGISIDEQHLLINFLNVYSILLQERKKLGGNAKRVDFNGTELSVDELKKQKKDLMDRINNNPIII